ncbi:MAG: ATP-binding protein [Candidatus Neomarinimicrobiota bacterium]
MKNWLLRQLRPRIDFLIYEFPYAGKSIVLFKIDATTNTPVEFRGEAYIRVGSYKKKLSDFEEKERKIWKKQTGYDWSAQICQDASIVDLAPDGIVKAKNEFIQKNPKFSEDLSNWDDVTFLNKAKVTVGGQITNTAVLLLGKPESERYLLPSLGQITWVLKDEKGIEKDFEHLQLPLLLNVDYVLNRIRNLQYRHLPDGTLFPIKISQYDPWVIREALHNCIAHQDYELCGRISVVEKPDELIFSNLGSFLPHTVEAVITQDAPPAIYRNRFLAQAMLNLNMIDTIGSGIKKMFLTQKERFFPLPDYDLTEPERVTVRIQGRILDQNFTRILINNVDLELFTVILLDKVQKRLQVSKEEHGFLKSKGLVEGRYPNLFVASKIASVAGEKAKYITYRGFDKKYGNW